MEGDVVQQGQGLLAQWCIDGPLDFVSVPASYDCPYYECAEPNPVLCSVREYVSATEVVSPNFHVVTYQRAIWTNERWAIGVYLLPGPDMESVKIIARELCESRWTPDQFRRRVDAMDNEVPAEWRQNRARLCRRLVILEHRYHRQFLDAVQGHHRLRELATWARFSGRLVTE